MIKMPLCTLQSTASITPEPVSYLPPSNQLAFRHTVPANVSGAAKKPDQLIKFKEIGKILVETMNKQGITRLINISGAVMALPGEKFEFKRKALKVLIYLFYKQMKQVQETMMAIILKQKDIDWTFVRPAMISDNKSKGF
jgi:putative NADH-flavin reductase